MRNLHRSRLHLALALLVGVTSLANGMPLLAGTISGNGTAAGSFSFKIDQNLITLDNMANICNLEAAIADGQDGLEDSLKAAMMVDTGLASMWYSYATILNMREIPGVLLANDANSTLNIIGMELVLDDATNKFMQFQNGEYYNKSYAPGEYTYIDLNTYDYYRVDPDLVPTNANATDDEQRLVMAFGNGGIKPGRATTFKVKTNVGMYLHEFFDESTLLNVIYQDPVSKDVYATGPQSLNNINEFNVDLIQQVAEGTKNGLHFQGMVDPYWLGGTIIPEPTSMILTVCGFSCMILRRRRVAPFH